MPEDELANPGPDAGASGAGPQPLGDGGWMAGDFQNGSGLLGLVAPRYVPSPNMIGAGSALQSSASPGGGQSTAPLAVGETGWLAGDLQNGRGLLGLVPPAGHGSAGQSQGLMAGLWATPDEGPDDSGGEDIGSDNPDDDGGHLDYGLATPGWARLEPLAANRTLKRQWSIRENQDWPVTEDGRSYHAHHKVPVADGGSKTLDNIEPMHPDEHMDHHREQGDFVRWGKRGASQRAAAAQPSPKAPPLAAAKPPVVPEETPPEAPPEEGLGALGLLGLIPMFTGLLSGRIRHDNFENFMSDFIGVPSPEDVMRHRYEMEKRWNPNAKMGDEWA